MKAESAGRNETGGGAPAAMLLDAYMELIAYTGYITGQSAVKTFPIEEIVKVYEQLMARSKKMAQAAGFSGAQWLEGLFPVCALIDESLLCAPRADAALWEQNQLQRRYFNTTAAGREFYDRLEALKTDTLDIRAVYEFCLAMGFKGQYFRASDIGKRGDIQYSQLKGVAGGTDLQYPGTLFPEAYEPEEEEKKRRHHKWKKYSMFVPVAILLPALVFATLYFWFDRLLDHTVARYFGPGF